MTESRASAAPAPEDLELVPLRHPWRWASAAVLVGLLALLVRSLATNPNLDLPTIGEYLFNPLVLQGVLKTIYFTVIAMVLGTLLAIVVAVMRLSDNPVMSSTAWLYTWFFRATPLLVQIIFWGFLGFLYSDIRLDVPFTDITLISVDTNDLVTPFVAVVLALTINEGAYAAEIVRAGILSVDKGQEEAAAALGLTRATTMRTIVLPQAMRVIIPPMGNETITMLKSTSLAAVVGANELLSTVQNIYGQNFKTIPLLGVAVVWYLVLVSLLSVGQYFLERRFGRSDQRRPSVAARWLGMRGAK